MTTETQLTTFMEKYPSKKVTVYNDMLVYSVKRGLAQRAAVSANITINMLGLDLVAIASKTWPNDSFIVKSNETEL